MHTEEKLRDSNHLSALVLSFLICEIGVVSVIWHR